MEKTVMVKKTNRDNDDIKEEELSTRLTNKKAKSTYGKKIYAYIIYAAQGF